MNLSSSNFGDETKEMSGEEGQVCELWISVCSYAGGTWYGCGNGYSMDGVKSSAEGYYGYYVRYFGEV